MSVTKNLVSRTVVIVTKSFNPSILTHYWLVKNGIIDEGIDIKGSLFTDQAVKLVTKDFTLIVAQQQLQVIITSEQPESIIQKTILKIIDLLPHVPYVALGINFGWNIVDANNDQKKLLRGLIYSENSTFFNKLDSEDAIFGGSVTKSFDEGLMNLNIVPVTINKKKEGVLSQEDIVQFNFNYHYDFEPNTEVVNSLTRILEKWNDYEVNSINVINKVFSNE